MAAKDRARIVFSDESWLTCNEHTTRNQWCRSKNEVLPIEKKSRWNVPSVLIFAAVGMNYKSPLIVLPSKKRSEEGEVRVFRLDSASYVRRCLQVLAPGLKQKIFQQDGARSHIAGSTLGYLKRKKIEVLPNWPAYSPDLSPIEYVWNDLQTDVGRDCPLTEAELVESAQRRWREMDQAKINRHVAHFWKTVRDMR